MDPRTFRTAVQDLLDELPDDFSEKIENVLFIVESQPSRDQRHSLEVKDDTLLLGLYQGVPLPKRSPFDYAGALPDQIIIFQRNIERAAGGEPEKTIALLRRTILHEIAHYFGITDKRLREIGAY